MKNKIILLILSLFFSLNLKSQNCFVADIIMLIDYSASESGNERLLIGSALDFVSELEISETQVRLGIIIFYDDCFPLANLSGSKPYLKNQIMSLHNIEPSGSTYVNSALLKANKMLSNERLSHKIIIIVSDGEFYDEKEAQTTALLTRSGLNCSIFGVQIGGGKEGFEKLTLLTGNPDLIEKSSPENLIEALKKLNLCN